MYGLVDEGIYRREQHRRYREMAALARTHPYAAKLLDESRLWLDTLPDGVQDLLLEHPVIEHAWSRGSTEGLHLVRVLGRGRTGVKFLITNLAKLSVKAVRTRFGLPEDPEPWLRRSDEGLDLHPGRLAHASAPAVLVRQVSRGPAVAPSDGANREFPLKFRHRFPDDHHVESVADIFEEREELLRLLSIAVRSKLVSDTVIDAVPPWMTLIDPNLRTGSGGGGRGVFDVWPKDRVPSVRDLDAFAAAAHGWLTFCTGKADRSHLRAGLDRRPAVLRTQDRPTRRLCRPWWLRSRRHLQENHIGNPEQSAGCPRR